MEFPFEKQSFLPFEICKLIKGIPIPSHDFDDSFSWGLSGSGSFTTKFVTWKAHDIPLDGLSALGLRLDLAA